MQEKRKRLYNVPPPFSSFLSLFKVFNPPTSVLYLLFGFISLLKCVSTLFLANAFVGFGWMDKLHDPSNLPLVVLDPPSLLIMRLACS